MTQPYALVDVAILAVRCGRGTTEEPFLSRISYLVFCVTSMRLYLPGTSSVCLSPKIPNVDLER